MADNQFRGDAQTVPQVNTITVGGTYADGQVYTVTINGKTVTYTSVSGDANQSVANALLTNLQGSSIGEFQEISWTGSTSSLVITATSKDDTPFTQTSGATGTGTLVTATTVTAAGPRHWDTAANWTLNAVPIATNDVYFRNSNVDCLFGIDQNTIALNSLNIDASYTGSIGLRPFNSTGSYYEYRTTKLKIRPTTLNIGLGDGNGCPWLNIDTGSAAACTTNVWKMAAPSVQGQSSLAYAGSHASNIMNIYQGNVGIAIFTGDTAQIPTINIGSLLNPANDVTFFSSAGLTSPTNLNQNGGSVTISDSVVTWTRTAGSASRIVGTGTITTLTFSGSGTFNWDSSGTIATATFRGSGAILDNSGDERSKTITNSEFTRGAIFIDSFRGITFTNAFQTDNISAPLIGYPAAPFHMQLSA